MQYTRIPAVLGLAVVFAIAMSVGVVDRAHAQPTITPGFPNVAQTPGAILSGLNAPQQGRTAIIAYHNGLLYTLPELPSSAAGSDFLVRVWDLDDPTDPMIVQTLEVSPMPINAHGYFKSGDYLVVGSNYPPEAPWSFRYQSPGVNERTMYPDLMCAGTRGCLFAPFFIGDTWWSYGEITGTATLQRDWVESANWDHLGLTGVIGHPFIVGNLLIFASDQSRTGVATYDISDQSNPVLLDVLTSGGAGGYWPELWGGDGKLYVVFPYRTGGNGFRVVDITDPSDLQFIADTPLPGDESMYIQFQDNFAFMGSHKVDMRTFESVLFLDGENTVRPSDGGTGINTSQFLLPLGNLLVTGGIGSNQGMAIWAHQAAPDTQGPYVGYHIPRAGQTNYPTDAPISVLIHETLETPTIVPGTTFIVRPLGGSPVAGSSIFAFNDILTFTPDEPLADNTTYEVIFTAGGIQDAAGNGMEAYSFTFSTGSSVGGNGAPQVQSFTASAYPVAPGANVTLTASATDPDADSMEYRFDFGDGSPKTAWSASTVAVTSYADPGHYQATVQVRDTAGAIATETQIVNVLTAPPGPLPTRSTPVLCDDHSRQVWKVNPDNDTLTALDADSLAVLYEVPVCDDPRAVTLSAQNELWVACHDDDLLHVLDASNGSFLTALDTGYGSAPAGIATSPDGSTVYATLQGRGSLRRFDATTRAQTGDLPLGPTPRALAVSGDGSRVLVTRFLSAPNRGEVWEVNTSTFTLERTIPLRKVGGDDNRDGTAGGRGVPNYLVGVAYAPDGQTALVTANKANIDRGLLTHDDLDQDNTVRNLLVRLDLTAGAVDSLVDIDNSDSASAVAHSPLGDYVFVALQGTNEVLVLDALEGDMSLGLGSLVTRLGSGLAPQGLCVDPTTERLFSADFMDRSVTAFEASSLFRDGAKTLATSTVATVASEVLSAPVLRGKRVFYNAGDTRMSGEGYLSCATCHLDGGHDGRTWDFTGRGEGLRNTTTLRGRAGMGHGNVHWSANFDEIQDFENDIRGAFGGTGFLTDTEFTNHGEPLGLPKAGLNQDLDDLAAYVTSLAADSVPRSPHRNADGSLTAQAQDGRALFQTLGCASCHAGAGFTDSTLGAETLHDVGTLRTTSGNRLGGNLAGIDTPGLQGLWNTAPYFHDGSAATLDAVFRTTGGTVVQAEDGTPGGGSNIVENFVNLNNDDTVHNRAFVSMGGLSHTLTLSGIDGGPGGVGAVEVRYSVSNDDNLTLTVNGGSPQTIVLSDTGNFPTWRHTHWAFARFDAVTLTPGATNTLVFSTPDNFPNISLDTVVVSTAAETASADPHRQVDGLNPTDRDALVAYLLQLDGTSTNPASFFEDGFESGDTTNWSGVVP